MHPGEGRICIEGTHSAKWLAGHASNFTGLSVHLDINHDGFDDFVDYASGPASIPRASNLVQLVVSCSPQRSERSRAAQKYLEDIVVEHAAKLTVLSLRIRALYSAPPMLLLKHLVLITRNPISPECCGSLACLPQLVTIFIEPLTVRDGQQYAVDLRGCVQLQRVCFSTRLPAKYWVPEACSVAVKCTAARLLTDKCSWHEEWRVAELSWDGRFESIEYVDWIDVREAFQGTQQVRFPQLTMLKLDVEQLGTLGDHMVIGSDTFPELQILRVNCKTAYLTFKPSVKLKIFCIYSTWAMRLDVEDQPALCEHMECLFCQGVWSDVAGAPVSIGRGVMNSERYKGSMFRCVMQRYGVLNNCGKPKRMGRVVFPQYVASHDGVGCDCTACHSCLGIAGI